MIQLFLALFIAPLLLVYRNRVEQPRHAARQQEGQRKEEGRVSVAEDVEDEHDEHERRVDDGGVARPCGVRLGRFHAAAGLVMCLLIYLGGSPVSAQVRIFSGEPPSDVCSGPLCDAPAPTCSDGVQNGDETGVDCGGSCDACPAAATYTVATLAEMQAIEGLAAGDTVLVTDAEKGGTFRVTESGCASDGATCYVPESARGSNTTGSLSTGVISDLLPPYALPHDDLVFGSVTLAAVGGSPAVSVTDAFLHGLGYQPLGRSQRDAVLDHAAGKISSGYGSGNGLIPLLTSGGVTNWTASYEYATGPLRLERQGVTDYVCVAWFEDSVPTDNSIAIDAVTGKPAGLDYSAIAASHNNVEWGDWAIHLAIKKHDAEGGRWYVRLGGYGYMGAMMAVDSVSLSGRKCDGSAGWLHIVGGNEQWASQQAGYTIDPTTDYGRRDLLGYQFHIPAFVADSARGFGFEEWRVDGAWPSATGWKSATSLGDFQNSPLGDFVNADTHGGRYIFPGDTVLVEGDMVLRGMVGNGLLAVANTSDDNHRVWDFEPDATVTCEDQRYTNNHCWYEIGFDRVGRIVSRGNDGSMILSDGAVGVYDVVLDAEEQAPTPSPTLTHKSHLLQFRGGAAGMAVVIDSLAIDISARGDITSLATGVQANLALGAGFVRFGTATGSNFLFTGQNTGPVESLVVGPASAADSLVLYGHPGSTLTILNLGTPVPDYTHVRHLVATTEGGTGGTSVPFVLSSGSWLYGLVSEPAYAHLEDVEIRIPAYAPLSTNVRPWTPGLDVYYDDVRFPDGFVTNNVLTFLAGAGVRTVSSLAYPEGWRRLRVFVEDAEWEIPTDPDSTHFDFLAYRFRNVTTPTGGASEVTGTYTATGGESGSVAVNTALFWEPQEVIVGGTASAKVTGWTASGGTDATITFALSSALTAGETITYDARVTSDEYWDMRRPWPTGRDTTSVTAGGTVVYDLAGEWVRRDYAGSVDGAATLTNQAPGVYDEARCTAELTGPAEITVTGVSAGTCFVFPVARDQLGTESATVLVVDVEAP